MFVMIFLAAVRRTVSMPHKYYFSSHLPGGIRLNKIPRSTRISILDPFREPELFLPFPILPSRWPQSPVTELPRGAAGCNVRRPLPVDSSMRVAAGVGEQRESSRVAGRRLRPHRGLARAACPSLTLSRGVCGQEELKFGRTLVHPGTVHSARTFSG